MNEEEARQYPRTHHSSHAEAIYEQCVWDEAHVLSIYRVLSGVLIADGAWHEFPVMPQRVGRYRVFREQYFQAVFAATSNPVYEALGSMDAVATQDDAEWAVWHLEGGAGYALSSTFALTPGQFRHQEHVDHWLW